MPPFYNMIQARLAPHARGAQAKAIGFVLWDAELKIKEEEVDAKAKGTVTSLRKRSRQQELEIQFGELNFQSSVRDRSFSFEASNTGVYEADFPPGCVISFNKAHATNHLGEAALIPHGHADFGVNTCHTRPQQTSVLKTLILFCRGVVCAQTRCPAVTGGKR